MRRLDSMNETISLNYRQKSILNLFAQQAELSREQIAAKLPSVFAVSKATLARDLKHLIKNRLAVAAGSGPSRVYRAKNVHPLITYVDLEQYFTLNPDERKSVLKSFTTDIFERLPGIITSQERQELTGISRSFTAATKTLEPAILNRELERYVIELSWKSSKIEGNTYTLLETETLIKQGQEASGRTKEEAIMILNHKDAFKTIVAHRREFKKITLTDLLELHNTLTKNLNIGSGMRKQAVGITGTTYQPPGNQWQIRQTLEQTLKTINAIDYPLEKASLTSTLIAYIQPFADGNKRTARMIANAILLANDYFPLSYRSLDENEYKQALILFYETNNLYHVKRLFLEQYRFTLNTYFLA
ncbi:MAG: Fic family protein [Candidatus Beckwithbacteria bacterium GW2011_GWB1_47_15]|uniref:Fic family protein n=1 Tax=Candidatus Beckwithbacteria bacterium GW2011_GWB1_47_15 TaxID=1618371 RepID=A0A0G1RW02_9BACT|nr:MAG: hypothetical protein UY43_C0001G0287 [Candidatus Beckwithbacteria bacterium GW2011_GWC1_49_16]KKU35208.1 MAG: Fic family protein [Candidatus Beckwithbacteria bacterium GW2011_GWA1_46_30]KKU61514.1 MAG: Fic family protein [Candidatus Beckwithbacteria bacterium GW2011_GWB1_47_15]KKU71718.1 MAG: Fic family protein [Candidatus Beckwithbacteria bacterium GW2011_GWA2_47_25]KKW03816.1 MAG: Fic family protein [Candidatus Beckwithbacteria bacterium GW2011_GWC2_49_11]HAF64209.1 cell filamentatio